MWQVASPPASWSAAADPAGRRLAASFSVGLARSFNRWASAGRMQLADRTAAASRQNSVILVALESAALGGVEGGEIFEGTDERASQIKCLKVGDEGRSDAGVGLASRPR